MTFMIEGADAETGDERVEEVEASTLEKAEQIARLRGLLVSKTTQIVKPHDHLADAAAPSPVTLSYSQAIARPRAPQYLGLQLAAFTLGVCAALSYLLGILLVTSAINAITSNRGGTSNAMLAVLGFFSAASPFAAGAILHGMSAGCLALRDIARNSFR